MSALVLASCVWLLPEFAFGQTQSPGTKPNQAAAKSASAADKPQKTSAKPKQPSAFAGISNRPIVVSAEAHAGRPYGIGRITYRLAESEKLIARSGAVLLTESNQTAHV